jgi:hypothetical protein
MAFVATLTGTGRNCTLTSGQPTMTVSSATGLVVGATIQGTGIPTGTKITAINGTTITMSANATAGGTQSLIFSSVLGSVLTIVLNASGDLATWQNVFNAGFGILQGTKSLFFAGALQVNFGSIVAGATFDHQDWTVEWGDTGRLQFDSGLLAGTQLGGYDTAGTLRIKAAGPTFIFNPGASNPAGGYSLFANTGGLLTQGGTFRMHDLRIIVRAGSSANRSPAFTSVRDFMDVENLILDYSEAAGTNASIGCGFGTILNPKYIRGNSGLARTNTNSIGNVIGLQFLGIFTETPEAKFAIPNNYVMEEYAPQITNTQVLGGFQDNTTETFANINLTSPNWGLSDLITKYQRYGGPNEIRFPRRVSFELNDSVGSNLTDVTLFIRSGATTIVNAVQTGDYSANTQALVLNWTGSIASYRVANTITNTIAQVAQFRKNGFISQSVSYNLNTAPYSQPIFMLADPAYGSVTPAQAAALTGVALDYTNKVITGSAARNLDQVYAFGQFSQALPANSTQADFQFSNAGTYSLINAWRLLWNSGALTMGTYNRTFNSSTQWRINGATSSLNLDRDDVVWTPAAYADQLFFENGATFNLSNNSTLTVNPTVNFGYVSPPMFGQNVKSNISDSTVTYNLNASHSGNIFGADINSTISGVPSVTVNYSNFVLTVNGASTTFADVGCFWTQASTINNWTINGTAASSVRLQVGVANQQLNGLSMAGTLLGSNLAANGRVMYMNNFTYTGIQSVLPSTQGGYPLWYFIDPVRSDNALFRWGAGSTPTGTTGFNAVLGFRPTITIDRPNYAPRMRITPSTLSSRYPVRVITTTALSNVPLSNFYRDTVFMATSDGFLPFVDSLDNKTVLNTIDWTVDFRQPGYNDQTTTFLASVARKGNLNYTASGSIDVNYVNASTGLADSALITVNTTTKTIAPVSGNLSWSPQRLYNALKNWWATYASNTDFLVNTGGGILDLGDYNTSSTFKFQSGNSNDALQNVRTTGLINAPVNDIPVTDANGTSTIWEFGNDTEPVVAGTSVALYDASGNTVFYQAVTTNGVYRKYIPTGTTGTYFYAIERYGYRREEGNFPANAGGVLFYVPNYSEDIGITDTQSNVAAYTTLSTTSQIYDATAFFRLSETGIKLGQLCTRDGLYLDFGTYNVKLKDDASAIVGVASGTITYKSIVVNATTKYNAMKTTPPKTITPTDTEQINVVIEDANGDSKLEILGGDNLGYELWKVTTATATDDYATGTLLTTLATNATPYRFIGISGFDIVGRDVSSGVRRRSSMTKGVYTQAFYVGNQIQLATDAPQLIENNNKLDELILKIDTQKDPLTLPEFIALK